MAAVGNERDMTHERFQLSIRETDTIRGDARIPAEPRAGAALVVCHGFKGFKDWGFFPFLCERLAEETGYPVVSFNFAGNGVGPDLENFTQLDRFARNTFSKELDDLRLVLDAIAAGELPGLGRCGRIGLLGHSRGGVSAIVTAAEDERVGALVTWAAVSHVDRWSDERKRMWREEGRIEVLNSRTDQMMPLGLDLLEDVERNRERLDLLRAASGLSVPYLIVHGTADESVSVSEATEIYEAAPAATAKLARIDGAGHTFGAVHPFRGSTPHLDEAIALSADWLSKGSY